MREWIRRLFRRDHAGVFELTFPEDAELLRYFTNVDRVVTYFEGQLNGATPQRPLLVVYGLGGMGKSSLLARLRSIILDRRMALAYYDAAQTTPTPLHVFVEFRKTMNACGVRTPQVDEAIKKYAAIDEKVRSKLAGKLITAGGTVAGATYGQPAAGGAIGGVLAESVETLRAHLTLSDFRFYTDPTESLGDAFLADLKELRKTPQACVIMLDTYERLAGNDEWFRKFVARAREDALIVIAGRDTPEWDRHWPGWEGDAQLEELRPMGDDNVRTLVRRYYGLIHGGEPPMSDVDAIVSFGRGIPLVVTIAVKLWVKYKYSQFQKVKPKAIVDVVDRVMIGVPPEMRPWLEAAATLRWFNQDLLKTVVGKDLEDSIYNEIRRFPFIRPHERNLAIHDAIRDIIDENLRSQNPERHGQMHKAAARIFESSWNAAADDDALPYLFEWLFHVVTLASTDGRDLLRQTCEHFIAAGRLPQLRALVADLLTISHLEQDTRQWLAHYKARALQLDGKLQDAETALDGIASSASRGSLLQRYSSCALAGILSRWDRIGTPDGRQRALQAVDAALHGAFLDTYTANALFFAGRVKASEGDWAAVRAFAERARDFFQRSEDPWGAVRAFNELQGAAVLQGDWAAVFETQRAAVALLTPPTDNVHLRARTLGYWAWGMVFAGNCHDAEHQTRESVGVAAKLEDVASEVVYARNLGLALTMQERYDEGVAALRRALRLLDGLGQGFDETRATVNAILGFALTRSGDTAEATARLDDALATKTRVGDALGMSETLVWQGHLRMAHQAYADALGAYRTSLEWAWTGRQHCYSEALVGIARALYSMDVPAETMTALERAEEHSRGYSEHLAQINLVRGHLALRADASDNSDAVISAYSKALVHALHYNRFELDRTATEIKTACAEARNRDAIIEQLVTFWTTSKHAESKSSPSLLELEQQARRREPGNGGPQILLIDRLRA